MTHFKTTSFPNQFWDKFDNNLLVGFDQPFKKLAKMHDNIVSNNSPFPPYNIKELTEDNYVIEMAVAGFDSKDLTVEVDDGYLIIKGARPPEEKGVHYTHRGIGFRNFTKKFVLNEFVEVKDATHTNGMLVISLERVVPDSKKPLQIPITSVDYKPQLLNE